MTLAIRRMRADDLEPILNLFAVVAGELLYIATEPSFDRVAYRARLERGLGHDALPTWVVADDAASSATAIGHLSLWESDDDGLTLGMMIAPERRGQGWGRQLLATALDWVRAAGHPSLALLVFPHNKTAIALYHAMGFEQVAYYEDDCRRQNGEVWDTILMRISFERGRG